MDRFSPKIKKKSALRAEGKKKVKEKKGKRVKVLKGDLGAGTPETLKS